MSHFVIGSYIRSYYRQVGDSAQMTMDLQNIHVKLPSVMYVRGSVGKRCMVQSVSAES